MKEFLVFLPLTIVFLAFKSTLFPNLPLPDLPLLIVFFTASRKASLDGIILAFVLGYLDDAFSGGIIGTSSFALVFIFASTHLLSKLVQFSTPLIRAFGAAFFALLKGAAAYAVLRYSNVDASFLGQVLLQALVTGALAPAIIAGFNRIMEIVNPGRFKDSES